MHSVMKLTLSKLMSGSSGELSAGLKQLLKHYVYLQGTQGNQKKVLPVSYPGYFFFLPCGLGMRLIIKVHGHT